MRAATIERKTRETEIFVAIELDGSGDYDIETGIGFFDHMLEAFTKHSMVDLKIRAEGDLHIDMHHTVEDVGIVMGQAVAKALGDCAGIRRFGTSFIPMDETLSRAAIDISKRPYLVWNVALPRPKLGDMDTELFKEWFHAFATNAGICLHKTCTVKIRTILLNLVTRRRLALFEKRLRWISVPKAHYRLQRAYLAGKNT